MLCFYETYARVILSRYYRVCLHTAVVSYREHRLPFCLHTYLREFCRILQHKRPPNHQYTNYQLYPTARIKSKQKKAPFLKVIYKDLKCHP